VDQSDTEHPPALPRRPPLIRRIAVVAIGLVVIGGAVAVLRAPQEAGDAAPKPVPPPQTSVREFAADGVVVPGPGNPAAQPAGLDIRPGPHSLRVGWGRRHIDKPEPDRAAGYEVRWGRGDSRDSVRLVAEPAVQLDGLENDVSYRVEVRTVDAYGQRSLPLLGEGVPRLATGEPPWAFVDRFTSRVVPDPVLWRLASPGGCGRATRGDNDDGKRLVISARCGAESLALRSRSPFRLHSAPVDDELGRFVVETDHPGHSGGELLIDLVPGPVDLIGGSPNGSPAPGQPGLAQDDPSLPPGTIRVRVVGSEATTVQVLVPPGTPRLGTPVQTVRPPVAEIGISARWELIVRADSVRVLRDGQVVGGGDVTPAWREATALLGFIGARSGLYTGVDLVGFIGAPTTAPVLMPSPVLDTGPVIIAAGSPAQTPSGGARVPGSAGAQLRVTLAPQNGPTEQADDTFTVDVGGRLYPARAVIPGQQLIRGVRYPVVVDLPPEALVLRPDGKTLPVRVQGSLPRGRAVTRIVHASIELTAPPTAVSPASGTGIEEPLAGPRPALARPSARFFDAAGKPIAEEGEVPRGRLVLEVVADARAGQRIAGEVSGLAGVEVYLDGDQIAGIPTTKNGPGIGGSWRLAVNTAGLGQGKHTVEIKTVGVDPRSAFAVTYAHFVVGA